MIGSAVHPRLHFRQVSVFSVTAVVLGGIGLGALTVIALSLDQALLALGAVTLALGAVITGKLREILLAIAVIDIGLGIDINYYYRENLAELGSLGGLNISVTTFALAILYLLWAAEYLCIKSARLRPRIGLAAPLITYVGATLLSALVAAPDLELSSFQVFLLAQNLLLYIYIASRVQTARDVVFICALLLLGLGFQGVLMIASQVLGQAIVIGPIATQIESGATFARVGGTVGSPNNAAAYLGMLLPLAIASFFMVVPRRYKTLSLLSIILGGISLILTFSRGGWVAFAIALSILGYFLWRRGWLAGAKAGAIVLGSLILLLLFQTTIIERLLSDDGGAAYSRIPLMRLAFGMIAEHPWIGIGANNFAFSMHDYLTPHLRSEWLYTAHNRYLVIWAETGLLGLLTFLWFLASTLSRGWRLSLTLDKRYAPFAMAITAAIVGHMTQMFVEVFNGRPLLQLLCVLAALISAATRMSQSAVRER